MKGVSRLMAVSIKTEKAKRTAPQMRVQPEGENTLRCSTELSDAGEHAAACNPNREIEGGAVFERHNLKGELGGAIE